eukprot:352312-Chlamydomonas_euryale.AAC.2
MRLPGRAYIVICPKGTLAATLPSLLLHLTQTQSSLRQVRVRCAALALVFRGHSCSYVGVIPPPPSFYPTQSHPSLHARPPGRHTARFPRGSGTARTTAPAPRSWLATGVQPGQTVYVASVDGRARGAVVMLVSVTVLRKGWSKCGGGAWRVDRAACCY